MTPATLLRPGAVPTTLERDEMPKRSCSTPGCETPAKCRGLCGTHYQAWRRANGYPRFPQKRRMSTLADVRAHCEVTDDGCWLWVGGVNHAGYGDVDGTTYGVRTAHRAAWLVAGRTLPPAPNHLDHLCRNRRCCNPDHLEPVTPQENRRRSVAAKTHCVNGHLYIPENRIMSGGKSSCKVCRSEQMKAKRRRAREAT